MMKTFICVFISVMCFSYLLIGNGGKFEVKTKDGIKHVYNPAVPAKGKVVLDLKKHLTIDPAHGEAQIDDLFFTGHARDKEGNIYLIDEKSVAIHKFSPGAKYIKSFLSRGQGPGEFDIYPKVQVSGSHIYIFGSRQKKIARFTTDGTFLHEFKFKRYYYSVHMIDNERFIGSFFKSIDDKLTHFCKCLGIYTLGEKNRVKLFEAENAGKFIVSFDKGSTAVFPGPAIYKDIVYAFDADRRKIYISFNKDYKIFVKDLEGTTKRVAHAAHDVTKRYSSQKKSSQENKIFTLNNTGLVIHKEHNNPAFKHGEKVDLVSTFGPAPDNARKAVIAALPDKLCAIESMDVLAGGCLLVRSVTGYLETQFDIFSKKGECVYSVSLPEGLDLEQITFYKGLLSGIENREDTPVYHIYKIESLPEVF